MASWKYTLRNVGLTMAAAGVGVVAAEGAAAGDGVAHHLVEGKVTAVGASSFTITNSKGTEMIDTTSGTGGTTYRELGTPVAPTAVADGQDVVVALSRTDSTPTAVSVLIVLDQLSGKVTGVSGSTITLSTPGRTREVITSPSTLYYSGKNMVSGVTAGEWVAAFGTRDTTTTPPELDALFVEVFTPPATPPRPHSGPDFHALFHGWAFGFWNRMVTGTDQGSAGPDAVTHSDQATTAPANAPAPFARPSAPRPDHASGPRVGGWQGGGWSGGGQHSGGWSQSGGSWGGGGS